MDIGGGMGRVGTIDIVTRIGSVGTIDIVHGMATIGILGTFAIWFLPTGLITGQSSRRGSSCLDHG